MTAIATASVEDPARVDCLSKIESSKMVLMNEPFDIFEIVNGYVSTVYAQAR